MINYSKNLKKKITILTTQVQIAAKIVKKDRILTLLGEIIT